MPGLVAQDYGLQGLLLAIQNNPCLQGVTLVLPVRREGLLQEDALRDGQSPRVPGVEKGKQAEVIKALKGQGTTVAQGLRLGLSLSCRVKTLSQTGEEHQDTQQPLCATFANQHLLTIPLCPLDNPVSWTQLGSPLGSRDPGPGSTWGQESHRLGLESRLSLSLAL